MNVISALMAPVPLPYFLLAMTVSTNPAAKGDNIYIILNPKITKCNLIQITAEKNPTNIPRTMAIIPHRFSEIVFCQAQYFTF